MRKVDYKALSPEMTNLIAFIATLITVIVLSKIGGSGADLAIMTALVAVLGSLVNNFRKSQPVGVQQADTVNQNNGGDNAQMADE